MRRDEFWPFFEARAEALLSCIEAAIGKPVARTPGVFTEAVVSEEYAEEPEEWVTGDLFSEELVATGTSVGS